MNARIRLSNRRRQETIDLTFEGHEYAVSVGFDTLGLLTDIVGVFVLSWGLVISRKDAIKLGSAHWAPDPDDDDTSLSPPAADRLRQARHAAWGLGIMILGYAIQIVATWMS